MHWLPEFIVQNEQEKKEHATYELEIQTRVFASPSQLTLAQATQLTLPEIVDQRYLEWLSRQGLSGWICHHGRTCGHAYHVPVCSEKEQALMERAARKHSLDNQHSQREQPKSDEMPLANPKIGGCTVCWKLSCLGASLRAAIDHDWRFLQTIQSLHMIPPAIRLHRLQRLYNWLYRGEHWNAWKSIEHAC